MKKNCLKILVISSFLLSSLGAYAGGKHAFQNHQGISVNKGDRVGKRVREKANHHYEIPMEIVDDLKFMADGNLNQDELDLIKMDIVSVIRQHSPCSSMKKFLNSQERLAIIEKEVSYYVETYHHLDFDTVAHQYTMTQARIRASCSKAINGL